MLAGVRTGMQLAADGQGNHAQLTRDEFGPTVGQLTPIRK